MKTLNLVLLVVFGFLMIFPTAYERLTARLSLPQAGTATLTGSRGVAGGLLLGAALGLVGGGILGNAGLGLILGALIGLVFGPALATLNQSDH